MPFALNIYVIVGLVRPVDDDERSRNCRVQPGLAFQAGAQILAPDESALDAAAPGNAVVDVGKS